MARNDPRNGAQREISLSRQEILPEVLREEAGECVKQAREHTNPGGEKVEIPAPAGLAHQHKWDRQIDERGSSHATRFAPIKTWVSEENGDATDEQAKEAERSDPVSDADDRGVPRRVRNI